MGFIELERFKLCPGVVKADFVRLDAEFQVWAYLHRDGLVRRTTAMADDGSVAVITVFGGAIPPMAPEPEGDGALAAFIECIDPASYSRTVYRDLD